MRMNRCLIVALLSCLAGWQPAVNGAPRVADEPVALLEGLGAHHFPITTDVPTAQAYFDQGFRLFYAFNFDESIRSFREAIRIDPGCAMCYWGVALALGPNINAPMDPRRGQEAYRTIRHAQSLAEPGTPREREYIDALAARYDPFAERPPLDRAYAEAMERVVDRYPTDADAIVLHAAAVMNLSPWDYWTPTRAPKAGIEAVLSRLAEVVTRDTAHAGACHFYIHLVEAAWPERAVPCAERLPALMPAAGHIVHMPAHVYIRVGRYTDAIERNQHAVHADEAYIAEQHPAGEYPLAYYPHNYHFLAFAASMAGQAEVALDAARKVASHTDRALLHDPDLGGTLQHFITTPISTFVRFSRWTDVLEHPPFEDSLTYPRGHWHFARGMAFVAQGRLDRAAVELDALRSLIDDPLTAAVAIFGLNTGPQILSIAEQVLAGRLRAAQGHLEEAVEHLSRGIELEEALTYNEPPDWNLPVRQVLAGVLRDAGRVEEAEAAYDADLAAYPGNLWSRKGLEELARRRQR